MSSTWYSPRCLDRWRRSTTRPARSRTQFLRQSMARYKGIATGRLLHADAAAFCRAADARRGADLLSTRIIRNEARSEEHTSELQSLMRISYAVFSLKKKKRKDSITTQT